MEASSSDHWRCNARRDRTWQGSALAVSRLLLAQFCTRLPPQLLKRLPMAAPQLGMRQSDITAVALDEYLRRYGF